MDELGKELGFEYVPRRVQPLGSSSVEDRLTEEIANGVLYSRVEVQAKLIGLSCRMPYSRYILSWRKHLLLRMRAFHICSLAYQLC